MTVSNCKACSWQEAQREAQGLSGEPSSPSEWLVAVVVNFAAGRHPHAWSPKNCVSLCRHHAQRCWLACSSRAGCCCRGASRPTLRALCAETCRTGFWAPRWRRVSLFICENSLPQASMRSATWFCVLALALCALQPAGAWPMMMPQWGGMGGVRAGRRGDMPMMPGCQVRRRRCRSGGAGAARMRAGAAECLVGWARSPIASCALTPCHQTPVAGFTCCCHSQAAPLPSARPCAVPRFPLCRRTGHNIHSAYCSLRLLKAMREGNSVVLKGLKFSGGELSAAQLPRHPQTWQEMEVRAAFAPNHSLPIFLLFGVAAAPPADVAGNAGGSCHARGGDGGTVYCLHASPPSC